MKDPSFLPIADNSCIGCSDMTLFFTLQAVEDGFVMVVTMHNLMLFFIAQALLMVKHSLYYTLLVMLACHHYLLSFYRLVGAG